MGKRILPIQLWDGDIVINVIIIIVATIVINVIIVIVITASITKIISLWSGYMFSINDANTVIYAKTITIHVS